MTGVCCRLCLSGSNKCKLKSVFDSENLLLRIYKYLDVEITKSDGISTMVCDSCSRIVNGWHRFKESVKKISNATCSTSETTQNVERNVGKGETYNGISTIHDENTARSPRPSNISAGVQQNRSGKEERESFKSTYNMNIRMSSSKSKPKQCQKSSTFTYQELKRRYYRRNCCPFCSVKFSSNSNFHRHLKLHEKYQDLGNITQRKRLKKKYSTDSYKRCRLECYHCQRYFYTKQRLIDHLHKCRGTKPDSQTSSFKLYKCSRCSIRYKDSSQLKRHLLIKHAASKGNNKTQISSRRNLTEPINVSQLNMIYREAKRRNSKRCVLCKKQCLTFCGLCSHLKFHLNKGVKSHLLKAGSRTSDDNSSFRKQLNEKLLKLQDSVREDRRDREAEEKIAFECNFCFRHFDKEMWLNMHLMIHKRFQK